MEQKLIQRCETKVVADACNASYVAMDDALHHPNVVNDTFILFPPTLLSVILVSSVWYFRLKMSLISMFLTVSTRNISRYFFSRISFPFTIAFFMMPVVYTALLSLLDSIRRNSFRFSPIMFSLKIVFAFPSGSLALLNALEHHFKIINFKWLGFLQTCYP